RLQNRLNRLEEKIESPATPPTKPESIADSHTTDDTDDEEATADAASATAMPREQPTPAEQTRTLSPKTPPTEKPDVKTDTIDPSRSLASQLAERKAKSRGDQTDDADPSIDHPKETAAPEGLEEQLGTRVFLWIGGLALALAGAFLVKYSFDNNLITPSLRVAIGSGCGLLLLGAGEWLRRKTKRVAEAVTAAGIADLFVCLLAATTLYDLVPMWPGLGLMAVITAAAVMLSLRHGPFVALLGLAGGLVSPPIIGGGEPPILPMTAYLLVLQLGIALVMRRRGWFGLGAVALAGSMIWAVVLAWIGQGLHDRLAIEALIIGSAVIWILIAATSRQRWLAMTGSATALILLAILAVTGEFAVMDLAMFVAAGAGTLVLARWRPVYRPLPWLAGILGAVNLVAWHFNDGPAMTMLAWTAGLGGLYMLGARALAWRSKNPAGWALGSSAAAIVYLTVARLIVTGAEMSDVWHWGPALAVAGLYTAMTIDGWWRRTTIGARAVGTYTSAAAITAAMAAVWGLDAPWWGGVLALEAAALTWLTRHPGLPGQAKTILGLALVSTGVMIFPGGPAVETGTRPVLNGLLLAYFIPVLGLHLTGRWLATDGDSALARGARSMALLVASVGGLWLIRHGFHPTDLLESPVRLFEMATFSVTALAAAHGLLTWDRFRPDPVREAGGLILATLGATAAVVGSGLALNPLWHQEAVGSWMIVNGLLYLYGLPALLAAGLIAWPAVRRREALQLGAGVAALALVFGLVTLEVRQAFVGSVLSEADVSSAEWWTYSAAWIGLGLTLLAAGVRWASPAIRWSSLAIMLVAIAKVFLLDTRQLQDLYRVLSFLGLGLSLIGLGWVYQRFVFREREPDNLESS
ncbi:MAG: DUF2339 domain-containing protein, partial [Phycisphaeraceae bacterium]|nr:DUF2339 domain-containing protein [Phycisphaeraceae bacterium]